MVLIVFINCKHIEPPVDLMICWEWENRVLSFPAHSWCPEPHPLTQLPWTMLSNQACFFLLLPSATWKSFTMSETNSNYLVIHNGSKQQDEEPLWQNSTEVWGKVLQATYQLLCYYHSFRYLLGLLSDIQNFTYHWFREKCIDVYFLECTSKKEDCLHVCAWWWLTFIKWL